MSDMASSPDKGLHRVTDLSAGSGMHFTDPLPRRWPDNSGKRRLCVCTKWDMCMAHAAQRDAATRATPLGADHA